MCKSRYRQGPGFWEKAAGQPGAGGCRSGYGPGFGWGFCRRGWGGPGPCYGPDWSGPDDEKSYLQGQAEALKAELANLEKRLAEMESE